MQSISKNKNTSLHPSVKKIFYVIGTFFLIFFIAVGYTIYIAQKNFEPVMDVRYYEKGLDYEKRNQEFKKAQEKNWKVSINLLELEKITKKYNLYIDLFNPNYLNDFFSDENRTVIEIYVSHPATLKRLYNFEFYEKDFKKEKDLVKFQKEIEIPLSGFYEFRIEIRPEKDAAIFYSKKIYVE